MQASDLIKTQDNDDSKEETNDNETSVTTSDEDVLVEVGAVGGDAADGKSTEKKGEDYSVIERNGDDVENIDNDGTLLCVPLHKRRQRQQQDQTHEDNTVETVSNICAICIDCYQQNDVIVWSNNPNCLHCFHKDCMIDYLAKTKMTAPTISASSRHGCGNNLLPPLPPCPTCRQTFLVLQDDTTDIQHVETSKINDGNGKETDDEEEVEEDSVVVVVVDDDLSNGCGDDHNSNAEEEV